LIAAGRFYRVGGWVHFLGLPLLGSYLAAGRLSASLAGSLAVSSFYLAFLYGINNVFDRQLDEPAGPAKNPLAGNNRPARVFLPAAIAPGAMAMVLSLFLRPPTGWLTCGGVLAGAAYSAPPLRLKTRPVVGFLSNGALFGVLFLIAWTADGGGLWAGVGRATPFCLLILLIEALHELEDVEPDRRAACATLPVRCGVASTRRVAQGALLAFAASFAFLTVRHFFPRAALISAALYFIAAWAIMSREWRRASSRPRRLRLALRYLTAAFGIALWLTLYWSR
jgi:4-hydroxybenzoate polyprenyltransferase